MTPSCASTQRSPFVKSTCTDAGTSSAAAVVCLHPFSCRVLVLAQGPKPMRLAAPAAKSRGSHSLRIVLPQSSRRLGGLETLSTERREPLGPWQALEAWQFLLSRAGFDRL